MSEPAAAFARKRDAERLMDEIDDFFQTYLVCEPEQRWAMILHGAATWAIQWCATFPRVLFGSAEEESGKTLAMDMSVSLCTWSIDAAGTTFDVTSALADAHLEPERGTPTVYRDEIAEVFPGGGQSRGNNAVGDILRRGYKYGRTRGRSRGGSSQRYNIFTPFLMTAVGAGVLPRDIRSRCIVIMMKQGTPRRYFDVRDAESQAYKLGRSLGQEIQKHKDFILRFRAADLQIPRLAGRKAEVWEPLFAVALALDGYEPGVWFKRCLAAFRSLALAQLEGKELTPRQEMLKLLAETAPDVATDRFVPGRELAARLFKMDQFKGRSEAGISKLIAEAMPVLTSQYVLPSTKERVRGYWLEDILQAWNDAMPLEQEDEEFEDEDDPFAVTDEDDDVPGPRPSTESTGGTGGTGAFTAGAYTVPFLGGTELPAGTIRGTGAHARPVQTGPEST